MIVVAERKIPKYVCWIDPGLHVGWAMLEDGEKFSSGQVHGRLEAGDWLHKTISARPGIHVGWEAYITGHTSRVVGDPGPAHEIIGVARWLTHHHGGTLLLPVPAESRTVAAHAVLKDLGWTWKGDHALSASQHLLAWCLREKYLKEKTDAAFGKLLVGYDKLSKAVE